MSERELQELEKVIGDVKRAIPGAVTKEEDPYGERVITIDRKQVHAVLAHLKAAGFDLLLDIVGVDMLKLEHAERFQLVYLLYSLPKDLRLRVRVHVPEDDMTVATVSDLWGSANWAEREAYDMFGFQFERHPNLSRILCHREFVGHALRKDYPVMKGQWATTTSDLMPDIERE